MANRKSTKKYYFSVEGETEEWYLLWLRDLINSTEEAAFKVAIDLDSESVLSPVWSAMRVRWSI